MNNWSFNVPNVDGWYWWRKDENYKAVIRKIINKYTFDDNIGYDVDISIIGGQWFGPLEEPK